MTDQTAINLPKTIQTIAAMAQEAGSADRRFKKMQLRDREYLVDGDTGDVTEVLPRFEDLTPLPPNSTVRDIDSLIAWCLSMDVGEGGGLVTISERGESKAVAPRLQPRNTNGERAAAVKPFFERYLPRDGYWLGYLGFLSWFDQVRHGVDSAVVDAIDLALKSVSTQQGVATDVQQNGAVINVGVRREGKVDSQNPIPKEIETEIPFGDPGFVYKCRFKLRAKADDNAKVAFSVSHDESDGAYDAYIEWCREQLEVLPAPTENGWTIVVAP